MLKKHAQNAEESLIALTQCRCVRLMSIQGLTFPVAD